VPGCFLATPGAARPAPVRGRRLRSQLRSGDGSAGELLDLLVLGQVGQRTLATQETAEAHLALAERLAKLGLLHALGIEPAL
jgi:hypothetical protein